MGAQVPGTGNGTSLTLVFAGDVMGHDSQIAASWYGKDSIRDYGPCFSRIAGTVRDADISVCNLELTFGGPPYKGYPRFSTPDDLAGALREAGFDILVNANNHALDRGNKGVIRTTEVMEKNHFIHTGTFTDGYQRELDYPLVVEKNGILLGILNYTYGTNGLREKDPVSVNRIDRELIGRDLEKVKLVHPDFIIVVMHWGKEYQRTENKEQEDLARFMLDHGAGAVIGAHPHVVQPIRFYPGPDSSGAEKMVAYSLGNFISNQRERYRNGGIMLQLTLEKQDRTRIRDFSYIPVWVHKPVVEGRRRFELVPVGEAAPAESEQISAKDSVLMEQFAKDTDDLLRDARKNSLYVQSGR